MGEEVPVPESCAGCGSCCTIYDGISIGDKEHWLIKNKKPLPEFEKYIVPQPTCRIERCQVSRFKLKIVNDPVKHCLAFDLDKKICTIYEHRPQVCRDYPRGCHQCRQILLMDKLKMRQYEAHNAALRQVYTPPPQAWTQENHFVQPCFHYAVVDGKQTDIICNVCYAYAPTIAEIVHEGWCTPQRRDEQTLGKRLVEAIPVLEEVPA